MLALVLNLKFGDFKSLSRRVPQDVRDKMLAARAAILFFLFNELTNDIIVL